MIIPTATVRTNRIAILSLVAAILAIASFCGGAVPIPFTGYVCFPASAVLGMVALTTGLISLGQNRTDDQSGRVFALIGSIVGGLACAAIVCAITAGILLLPEITNLVRQFLK